MLQNFAGIELYNDETTTDGVPFSEGDILIANIRPYLKKVWKAKFSGACSTDVLVLHMNSSVNSDFLYYIIARESFINYVMCGAKGSKMPRGDKEQILGYDTYIPSKEEQNKLSLIMNLIDHRIEKQRQLVESLKLYKRGLLSKLFPKNGENVPRYRFEGFTNAWEQRKFGDCYKMNSGYAFKLQDYCESGIAIINGESIQHGNIVESNLNFLPEDFLKQYKNFNLHTGDIVVGLNRPITNGELKIARIPCNLNNSLLYQRAGKITYKDDMDGDFSFVLLSQEILKHTQKEAVGSDQPFISTYKLDKWELKMPTSVREQKKIGEYFSHLDHLITLHQRKYDFYKKMKNALLQQMFI